MNEENKSSIEKLLKTTEREGIEDLLHWMVENGFYSAPCSSKYHLAQPGGLAEHSLNVFRNALSIAETLVKSETGILTYNFINSIVICSLLHDLGKAGQFGKPNYYAKFTTAEAIIDGKPDSYETNKNLLYVPHEIRSIAIASKFIDLTEEEQFAILYHNGLYGELQGMKNHETPLYLILHYADMWAARVVEK